MFNVCVLFCLLFVELVICTLSVLDFLDLNLISGRCKGWFSVHFFFRQNLVSIFLGDGFERLRWMVWC